MSKLYKPVRFLGVGRVFETDGHVGQLGLGRRLEPIAERFLIHAANADVEKVAEASGEPSVIVRDSLIGCRIREFTSRTGAPVTLEADTTLYADGRDVGFLLRVWRSPERIPAQAMVQYRLGDEPSEHWGANAGVQKVIAADKVPATRPLEEQDCVNGYVIGHREIVLDAMSQHLQMALTDPESLRANVAEVQIETHLQDR